MKFFLKITLISIFCFSLCAFVFPTPTLAASDQYMIDGGHSSVLFRVKHLNVAYFHGRFNKVEGSFRFDPQNPKSGAIELTVQVESVDTNSKKRDLHLKSPDFFSAKEFPSISFKSTKFEKLKEENMYRATGNLTFRGVTKEISLDVEHTGSGQAAARFGYRTGFETSFTIKRSDFGMNFMMGMLGDDIRLTVSLEGVRK